MQPIYIPHLLKMPQTRQTLYLDQMVPELESLTPVRGELTVRHGGTFLEVTLKAETIVTLLCDRCIQNYNHRLVVETAELIWLDKTQEEGGLGAERELAWEDLSETLPPDGHFDAEKWLYEQLMLAHPLRRLCGKSCQAPVPPPAEALRDQRWSALEILKQQLSSQN